MKKTTIIISIISLCVCVLLCSCAKSNSDNNNDETSTSTSAVYVETTKPLPTASTTKKPTDDKAKGKKLENAVIKASGKDKRYTNANSDGTFEFRIDDMDLSKMYAQERNDTVEAKAYKEIEAFVNQIKEFYPDIDSIKLYSKDARQISYGDNGVDSVIYTAVYINSQNQTLIIHADSNGSIYSAKCKFTW